MLADLNTSHWQDYARRVAELYPPLAAGDGYDEVELVAVETRLGCRLPRILREFYRLAGRRDDLTRHLTQPLPPEFLERTERALLFTRGDSDDHDNIPTCSILQRDLGHDDPPVARAENDAPPFDWTADHERLSSWFVSMLYYVAVRGGLACHASAAIDETELPMIAAHWPRVDLLGCLWDHRIVSHKAGQVICVAGHAPNLTLLAAGRTAEDLATIARRLQVEWDET